MGRAAALVFLCVVAVLPSRALPADFTHAELRRLGAAEFIRLARDSWERKDFRGAVTFAIKARRIRHELFGSDDPAIGEIDREIDAAIEMLQKDAAAPGNRVLLMENDELERLTERGDADALHELATRYAHGLGGLSRDLVRAIGLLEVPASKGNPDSLFELGRALMESRVREELTARWGAKGPIEPTLTPLTAPSAVEIKKLNEAAKKGHPGAHAFVALGLIDQGRGEDSPEARKLAEEGWKALRESARAGNSWGQYLLGNCLAKGFGIGESRAAALPWARQAADQGMPEGEALLAELTLSPGPFNVREGTEGFRGWVALYCAAEQGYWLAYYPLGLRLVRGEGIAADRESGREWLEKATAEGHLAAAEALRKLH